MEYPIEKCRYCERYNQKSGKMRNKLRCMFECEEYIKDQTRKVFEYNRAVSGEEFDTTELYDHGKKVYGSGWKNGKTTD